MKSARITAPNEPLSISDSDTPKPEGVQVLVKVNSVGVCHSDLHLWEGGYDLGDGQFMKVTDRGVKYPVTPGHEIVGTVEDIGNDVSGIVKGYQVLVFPWIGCGECPACKVANENLCDVPKSMGVFQDGGYSDYALIPNFKYLAKLDGVDPDAATSLACSGLTAYTAIKKANINSNHAPERDRHARLLREVRQQHRGGVRDAATATPPERCHLGDGAQGHGEEGAAGQTGREEEVERQPAGGVGHPQADRAKKGRGGGTEECCCLEWHAVQSLSFTFLPSVILYRHG